MTTPFVYRKGAQKPTSFGGNYPLHAGLIVFTTMAATATLSTKDDSKGRPDVTVPLQLEWENDDGSPAKGRINERFYLPYEGAKDTAVKFYMERIERLHESTGYDPGGDIEMTMENVPLLFPEGLSGYCYFYPQGTEYTSKGKTRTLAYGQVHLLTAEEVERVNSGEWTPPVSAELEKAEKPTPHAAGGAQVPLPRSTAPAPTQARPAPVPSPRPTAPKVTAPSPAPVVEDAQAAAPAPVQGAVAPVKRVVVPPRRTA